MGMGRVFLFKEKIQGSGMSPEPALGEAAPLLITGGADSTGLCQEEDKKPDL